GRARVGLSDRGTRLPATKRDRRHSLGDCHRRPRRWRVLDPLATDGNAGIGGVGMNAKGETTKTRGSRRYTSLFWNSVASCVFVLFVPSWFLSVNAHSGPPFPIVNDHVVGAYSVSVWTDPDATDDQTAAGKFWVTVQPAARGIALPESTQVRVSVTPLDRAGP